MVGSGKSPGLHGLHYELYLMWSHIFVSILTDLQVCDHAIEKGQRWWPGLNTKLKIWAKIQKERLQSVAEILLRLEQNCAVKGQTIQSNLNLIRTILVCKR